MTWNFGSEEAAYWIFIASKLEISPLDIIIDIDVKFDALKDVSGYMLINDVVLRCIKDTTNFNCTVVTFDLMDFIESGLFHSMLMELYWDMHWWW